MNKHFFVFVALLTIAHVTTAQDLNMLSGNPQWTYGWFSDNEFSITLPIAMIQDEYGMIEKDGRSYHQLYQIERLYIDNGEIVYSLYDPVGVREEDGKVYLLYEDYKGIITMLQSINRLKDVPIPYLQTSENELLFYDFTLKAGDKYPTSASYGDIYVEKVDTVVSEDGQKRKLFTLTNGLQILEGIGCLNTPNQILGFALLHYLYPPEAWVYNDQIDNNRLYEYKKDDQVVYRGYEVPANVNHPLGSHPSALTPWYSLSGRRLTAPPTRPGLYIKDGHKVLIK